MPVEITELIMVPMVFHLLVVLLCWVVYLWREETRGLASPRHRIYRCRGCEQVYFDARDVPLARCPRCGCLNESVKR